MNVLKESLFPSATSGAQIKGKRSRPSHSRISNATQEHQSLFESLLPVSEISTDNIELGTIDSDNEDIGNNTKLNARKVVRSRNSKQQPKTTTAAHGGGSIVIVEKPIRPQETIQSFAIRYRVPVSQLKRLNNLQNDQDFYALTYCRVPVRRFGLLHESTAPSIIVNINDQSSTSSSLPVTQLTQENHHAFLKAMDHDLASMRAKVEQLIETPSTSLIPDQPTMKMMMRSTTTPRGDLNCDGADCGCKFWHILIVIILVALFIPLFYIYVYVKSSPDKSKI